MAPTLKIDRDYRRSREIAPYLCWDGDLPRPVLLSVDMDSGEAFLTTLPDGAAEAPPRLKTFPVDPCLTIHGIDALFDHPGVKEALEGVLKGDKESEAYLWEIGTSSLYDRLEGVQLMAPWEWFQDRTVFVHETESIEQAAERICKEALEDLVYLKVLDVEFFLEGDDLEENE